MEEKDWEVLPWSFCDNGVAVGMNLVQSSSKKTQKRIGIYSVSLKKKEKGERNYFSGWWFQFFYFHPYLGK